MNDMSAVIIAKSDQWNADDFAGGPRTFTVESVAISPGQEQPVSIKLTGSGKVFRPCKTVSRILVAAWGADANRYPGRSCTLYCDPDVKWGGMAVGGIRVSHISHIDKPLVIALQEKKGSRKVATIKPLVADVASIALTLDTGRALIAEAPDMAALERAWKRKDMAPFRGDLQADLADRKAVLQFEPEGRADSDHGERTDAEVEA